MVGGHKSLMKEYTASSGNVWQSLVGLTNCTLHKILSFRRGYVSKMRGYHVAEDSFR